MSAATGRRIRPTYAEPNSTIRSRSCRNGPACAWPGNSATGIFRQYCPSLPNRIAALAPAARQVTLVAPRQAVEIIARVGKHRAIGQQSHLCTDEAAFENHVRRSGPDAALA